MVPGVRRNEGLLIVVFDFLGFGQRRRPQPIVDHSQGALIKLQALQHLLFRHAKRIERRAVGLLIGEFLPDTAQRFRGHFCPISCIPRGSAHLLGQKLLADQPAQNGLPIGLLRLANGRFALQEAFEMVLLRYVALGDGLIPDGGDHPVQRFSPRDGGQAGDGSQQQAPRDQKLCPILMKYWMCDSWRTSTPPGTATWNRVGLMA